jgi:hypothetical protein
LTVLKYVNPPSATVSTVSTTRVVHFADFQDPEGKPELVTTTVKDYDLAETGKAMKSLFMGVAMMCFLVSRATRCSMGILTSSTDTCNTPSPYSSNL